MTEFTQLTLQNIGGGAAEELFHRELERVVRNVADPDTPAEAGRTITLTFKFKPFADRKGANIGVQASSKLADARSGSGLMWLGRERGELVALTQNPEQGKLFEEEDPQVVSIDREGTHDEPTERRD